MTTGSVPSYPSLPMQPNLVKQGGEGGLATKVLSAGFFLRSHSLQWHEHGTLMESWHKLGTRVHLSRTTRPVLFWPATNISSGLKGRKRKEKILLRVFCHLYITKSMAHIKAEIPLLSHQSPGLLQWHQGSNLLPALQERFSSAAVSSLKSSKLKR